jgi:hypothetical protein
MLEHITEEYVATHRTKKGKIRCPSCGGNDLGIKEQDRFAHCWECGVNYRIGEGRIYRQEQRDTVEFDTSAIRALYGQATEYYHSCIDKEHREFLRSRGIDDNAIDLFKIGFCPPSTHPLYTSKTAKESGIADGRGTPWLANRIVFPYIAENEITDIRGRIFIDDGGPKYKSLYHGARARGAVYPFNYDAALQKALKSKVLIITEGEIKAVIGDLKGFAVVGLPGMTSSRQIVLQPGVKIVVIYDNSSDPEDRLRVDRAIANLSPRLVTFSVVTLPLLGEQKMDIDSFLLHAKGGPDWLQHMVDNAVDYTRYKELRRF